MSNTFEDIWKIDLKNALKGRTWHWWWWLCIFKNPERPKYPRQFMILWATRNYKKNRINDFLWKPKIKTEIHDDHTRFEGMVTSWYYDGEKMHDPLIIDVGPAESKWDKEHGSVHMKNDKGIYSFDGKELDFRVKVDNPDVSADLHMTKWTDHLAKRTFSEKIYPLNQSYTIFKYRGLKVTGKIRVGSKEHIMDGKAYFQKVKISSITPNWYWAMAQSEKGAYLQYFNTFLGIPSLRQSLSHYSSLNWGAKTLSRSLDFYDPVEDIEHAIKIKKIEKRYVNDLPIFTIVAEEPPLKVSTEIETYARCCWHISQPAIWPLWLGLYYNEYPARLTKLKFTNGKRTAYKDDFGDWFCNAEHTWGVI